MWLLLNRNIKCSTVLGMWMSSIDYIGNVTAVRMQKCKTQMV